MIKPARLRRTRAGRWLLALLLAAGPCAWPAGAAASRRQGRKSSAASRKKVPTFELGFEHWEGRVSEPGRAAEARQFLWESWRRKRRADCLVITHTIEGEPRPVNYHVRPDAWGRWHVAADWEWWCCWSYGMEGKPAEKRTGSAKYYGVRRIDMETRQPVPDGSPRKPDTYFLVLEPTPTKPGETPAGRLL